MSTPPAQEWIEALVRNGAAAADPVAIAHTGTEAEKTRKIIAAALEALARNNMIRIVEPELWPPYFAVDPPSIRADVDRAMEIIRSESYPEPEDYGRTGGRTDD